MFLPESSSRVVRVIGLEPSEDDGGGGGPGNEDMCAFRDHTDRSPGSNLHTNTVVAIHHASLDLNLKDKGYCTRTKQMLSGPIYTRDTGP